MDECKLKLLEKKIMDFCDDNYLIIEDINFSDINELSLVIISKYFAGNHSEIFTDFANKFLKYCFKTKKMFSGEKDIKNSLTDYLFESGNIDDLSGDMIADNVPYNKIFNIFAEVFGDDMTYNELESLVDNFYYSNARHEFHGYYDFSEIYDETFNKIDDNFKKLLIGRYHMIFNEISLLPKSKPFDREIDLAPEITLDLTNKIKDSVRQSYLLDIFDINKINFCTEHLLNCDLKTKEPFSFADYIDILSLYAYDFDLDTNENTFYNPNYFSKYVEIV